MSKRKRSRDVGLIQFDHQRRPEKRVSYDEYNTGEGPQPVVGMRCADGPPEVSSVQGVCVKGLAAIWLSWTTEAAMMHMRHPAILCMPCLGTARKAAAA
jgi:hypothetical protein